MNINRNYLTKINFTDKNSTARIKYIVIHYFGGLATAENLAKYWARTYAGASAHYAVGHSGEIFQIVEDDDVAWHCGAKSYKHAECRNTNSIGIEMAVKKKSTDTQNATDKDWYFTDETVAATIELTRMLMKKYNIPADHVIRHYDVTGKICPNPYVYNAFEATWQKFKAALTAQEEDQSAQEATDTLQPLSGTLKVIYEGSDGVNYRTKPDYDKKSVAGAVKKGTILTIVGEVGDFYKVKSGWYITKRADLVQFTPKETKRLVKIIYKGSDGVNYRTKPDYDKKSVAGTAKYGEAFTIVGEEGDFYKTKSGYYITKRADLVTIIEVA